MANPLQKQFDKSVLETEEMYRKKLNSLLGVDSDPLTDPDVMAGAKASAENNRKQESLFQERMAADKKASAARQAQKEQEMSKQMEAQEFRRRDQEAAEKFKRQPLSKGGKFPDLTGDGEVTQADVLKGRKVFKKGSKAEGITASEHIGAAFMLKDSGEYTQREAILQAATQLGKAKTLRELDGLVSKIKIYAGDEYPEDLKKKINDFRVGDSSYKTFGPDLYGREFKAEGSLLIAREKYGLGSVVKKAISKAIQSSKSNSKEAYPGEAGDTRDIEEFEKILSTPNKDAIFFSKEKLNELKKEIDAPDAYAEMLGEFVIVRQQDDEIIKKGESLGYDPKKIKSILEGSSKELTRLRSDFDALSEKRLSEAENRAMKAEGSLMMPEEGMPVDTYPNIPEDEMDAALESQLPDAEMEENYIQYVMDESLDDEEQEYLVGVLQNDPRLSDILDKVITVASEFSGAGEVEGPGTGVSDSIPARLSDGEFVFTRKATDQIGADQLQTMMDDAERAYDGGYQMKAIGGYMQEDPEEQDSPLSQTDEEIKKLMVGANKMPSLQ